MKKFRGVLNFERITVITTRAPRNGEKNNVDRVFVSNEEYDKLMKDGQIAYEVNMLGNKYGYPKKSFDTNKNVVFEVYYNTIADLKRICPDMKVIYIFPSDINIAKQKLKERNLKKSVEQARLQEIDEHYKKITSDKNLMEMFDYIVYNNYDKESEEKIIEIVRKLMKDGV